MFVAVIRLPRPIECFSPGLFLYILEVPECAFRRRRMRRNYGGWRSVEECAESKLINCLGYKGEMKAMRSSSKYAIKCENHRKGISLSVSNEVEEK